MIIEMRGASPGSRKDCRNCRNASSILQTWAKQVTGNCHEGKNDENNVYVVFWTFEHDHYWRQSGDGGGGGWKVPRPQQHFLCKGLITLTLHSRVIYFIVHGAVFCVTELVVSCHKFNEKHTIGTGTNLPCNSSSFQSTYCFYQA